MATQIASISRRAGRVRHALPAFLAACVLLVSGVACAVETVYEIDPAHTFPSFEADHMGGLSVWRGKFNRTTGRVLLDRTAGSGSVNITVDADSIDYGLDDMNAIARSDKLFDTAKYPTAVYRGTLSRFEEGKPRRVAGELTLHGITKPLELTIVSFKCVAHPMLKREVCGADVQGAFDRDAFGIDAGKDYGFNMRVALRIQVEAVQAE